LVPLMMRMLAGMGGFLSENVCGAFVNDYRQAAGGRAIEHFAFAGLSYITSAMQVKLLDLVAQYVELRREVRKAIDEVCDAQGFILGPVVDRFEKNLAAYCGTKHAIGVSSGTDALLCAMMALGIKPGDEVICPSFTFFATAGSIARLGAVPVFADIDPETFNVDPTSIKSRITRKTRAIMPVHLFGQIANMEAINAMAKEHDLAVIEDAAQAIGAKRNGEQACTLGLCGCLSFFPSKNLGGFGDSGAICTNDDAFAQQCRIMRVHGTERQYFHRFIGGNFRIDAIQAAVLDVKLKYLDQWHERRRRNAALYEKLLAGSRVKTPKIDPGNYSIYNQYVIRVENRDQVKERLAAAGVGSAVYYPLPLHLQECFASYGGKAGELPHSERASQEVLALPIYPELTEEQITYVANAVLSATGQ
jgi:dTDP-4-amino-4,6-dideoxygalactose transaminase